jgi:hypothetical protein
MPYFTIVSIYFPICNENPIYFPILSLFFHLVYVFPICFPMFPICFLYVFPMSSPSWRIPPSPRCRFSLVRFAVHFNGYMC